MRAIATKQNGFRHVVQVRDHQLTVDEGPDHGGEDAGPCPQELLAASLASCTAITIEMYAQRKGWDVGDVEVECDYQPAERGCPTRFTIVIRVPDTTSPEQAAKLRVVAAKCPIHRTLDGEVMFDERVERLALAR
jgi:putative redox protein